MQKVKVLLPAYLAAWILPLIIHATAFYELHYRMGMPVWATVVSIFGVIGVPAWLFDRDGVGLWLFAPAGALWKTFEGKPTAQFVFTGNIAPWFALYLLIFYVLAVFTTLFWAIGIGLVFVFLQAGLKLLDS